jgi:site-specific recombinase XerD
MSAHQHYRNLRVFSSGSPGSRSGSGPTPCCTSTRPRSPGKLRHCSATRTWRSCSGHARGTTFEDGRDAAIARLLINCGERVSGVANIYLEDVSLRHRTILIVLKAGDEHVIPFGRKTAAALDRYLRSRARHQGAESPWLWLGVTGRDTGHFGSGGIQDMLERRARAAGLGKVTPQMFRRTFAHAWLAAGRSEMDAAGRFAERCPASPDERTGDGRAASRDLYLFR